MPTQTTPMLQLVQTWLNLFEEWKAMFPHPYCQAIQKAMDIIGEKIANECDWMVNEEKLALDFQVDLEIAEQFLAEHGPFPTCPF